MTCAERIRKIRLMEKMEKSNRTTKTEDSDMRYHDRNGDVMIEARMVRREDL